jgi:hypothetical protein
MLLPDPDLFLFLLSAGVALTSAPVPGLAVRDDRRIRPPVAANACFNFVE